jgi:hypothetical protein
LTSKLPSINTFLKFMISRGNISTKRFANTRTQKSAPKDWHFDTLPFPALRSQFFSEYRTSTPKKIYDIPWAYTPQTFRGPPWVNSIMNRPAWKEWNIPSSPHSNRCGSKKALRWIWALPYCNVHRFWFLAGNLTHDWLLNEFKHGSSGSCSRRSTIARRPAFSKDMCAVLVGEQGEVAVMHVYVPRNTHTHIYIYIHIQCTSYHMHIGPNTNIEIYEEERFYTYTQTCISTKHTCTLHTHACSTITHIHILKDTRCRCCTHMRMFTYNLTCWSFTPKFTYTHIHIFMKEWRTNTCKETYKAGTYDTRSTKLIII